MIAIYGAGYVGLVTAVCLSKLGHYVMCIDIDKDRVAELTKGNCPIYEAQLPQLLNEQLDCGLLSFTSDAISAMQSSTIHIIAVGTPGLSDGRADLSFVFAVAKQIVCNYDRDCILVVKSTVPVGTGDMLAIYIKEEQLRLNKNHRIDVVSNPEFLREGHAVNDFLHADRIILGGEGKALIQMKKMYSLLVEQGVPIQCMSRVSAELTKYTANAMLACKISFMNQISQIAERVGADIEDIREGISLDHRIGSHFLQAGIGYGGSCFPKDVRALVQTAKDLNVNTALLEAIDAVNDIQKNWVIDILKQHFSYKLEGLTIGLWGLAFKPGTDDMREASSLVIVNALIRAGVILRIYDPVAISVAKQCMEHSNAIVWCNVPEQVLSDGVDALIIATEWNIFKTFPLERLCAELGRSPVIDGRNCFDVSCVKNAGLSYYYSVGRPLICGEVTLEELL